MTGRHALRQSICYGTLAALCAIVVGAVFQLFVAGSGSLALLALAVGSVVWGLVAGALGTSGLALPTIAVLVELTMAFEFKRIYVLDYAGRVPRTLGVFAQSIFGTDLMIVGVLVGLGWVGWRWQTRELTHEPEQQP